MLNIGLENPSKPGANSDKTEIMAAVREYYATFGRALKSNDLAVLAQKYGYLQPTGQDGDGVNDWQHDFQVWSSLGIKDYSVSFDDPILMVAGDTATADITGQEKIVRSEGNSGRIDKNIKSIDSKLDAILAKKSDSL